MNNKKGLKHTLTKNENWNKNVWSIFVGFLFELELLKQNNIVFWT